MKRENRELLLYVAMLLAPQYIASYVLLRFLWKGFRCDP